MPRQTPLTLLEHQIEFVKCHESIGSDHELMTKVSLSAADIIIKSLSTCEKMTVADKTTALMLVRESPMMQQDKDAVIPLLTAMPAESDQGPRLSSLQTHDFIENYIPKWVWDVLSSDVHMHRKLHVMATVFAGLSLWHPTEGTSGRATITDVLFAMSRKLETGAAAEAESDSTDDEEETPKKTKKSMKAKKAMKAKPKKEKAMTKCKDPVNRHALRKVGGFVFCAICGSHSKRRVKGLGRPCSKSVGQRAWFLHRLLDGRHPKTGEILPNNERPSLLLCVGG